MIFLLYKAKGKKKRILETLTLIKKVKISLEKILNKLIIE